MKVKPTYLYFALTSLAAVAFRLFLLLFSIDSTSGFLKDGYWGISAFMLILIILALVFVFILSLRTKDVKLFKTSSSSIYSKIVSFLFAVSILFEILFSPLAKFLPVLLRLADLILGVLAFLVIILSAFYRELNFKYNPIYNVAILVFFIVRLICVFTIFSAFSMIIDIVFELAALCGMLVGFLCFSKCENFEQEKIKSPLYFAALLFSSALGITASLPKVLLNITGNSEYIHINGVPMYSVFFASIFLLLYAVENFKDKENENC